MMPMFVQTDRHVIDVSKIVFMEVPARGQVVAHFTHGKQLTLSRVDAEQLMDGIHKLGCQRLLATHRSTDQR